MRVKCSWCHNDFQTERVGRQFCPHCGAELDVPAPGAQEPAAAAPAAPQGTSTLAWTPGRDEARAPREGGTAAQWPPPREGGTAMQWPSTESTQRMSTVRPPAGTEPAAGRTAMQWPASPPSAPGGQAPPEPGADRTVGFGTASPGGQAGARAPAAGTPLLGGPAGDRTLGFGPPPPGGSPGDHTLGFGVPPSGAPPGAGPLPPGAGAPPAPAPGGGGGGWDGSWPPGGAAEPPQDEDSPWERRAELGAFAALAATWKAACLDPKRFYARLKTSDVLPAFFYGWIMLAIGNFFAAAWNVPIASLGGEEVDVAAAVAQLFFLPLGAAVGIWIGAAVVHLGCMIFGCNNRGFEATFRAMAFAQGPALLGVIPLAGAVAGSIWTLVLVVIGLQQMQRTTTGKALGAALLPTLIGLVLCGCVVAIVAAVLAGGFAAAGMQTP